MVTIDSSFLAVHVYDVGRIISVKYVEWVDGPALQLVLLLDVRRIDVVIDADTFFACIHSRGEVTLIALSSLFQGLHDGRNLLS